MSDASFAGTSKPGLPMSTESERPDPRAFRRNPEVEEAPLQGDLMLFDPGTSRFFVLNRTMTFVWRRCDGAHGLAEMLQDLRSEFGDVDASTAEGDLKKALGELASLGLVVDLP
jgi:coenzyme PQQ synthesis protein D (PqqD)